MSGIATRQMAVLDALKCGECLTVDELTERVAMERRDIVKAAGSLILNGHAERVEIGCYRLTDKGREAIVEGKVLTSGPNGPHTVKVRRVRRQTLNQRAWNVMRLGRVFTVPDLVMATAHGERFPESALQRYCKKLTLARYLARLPVRERGSCMGSNGFIRYRLLDDTGPIAPVIKAGAVIFDPNTRETRPCQ